jgi:hypothetical protein
MPQVGHLESVNFELYHTLCTENFLPGRIVHRTTDRKRDGHGEVTQALQGTETEYVLKLLNALLISRLDERIDLVDDVDDSGDAIRRSKLDDWIVPLRVLQQCLGSGTATNATRKDRVISLHGESSVGSSKRSTIHDPRNIGSAQTLVDTREFCMLPEVGIVGNGCAHVRLATK